MRKSLLALAVTAVMSLAAFSVQAAGLLIGASIHRIDDTFIVNMCNNMEVTADGMGAEIEIEASPNDQAKQLEQIDAMIKKGVNALIVNIVDRTSADKVVAKAKAANLPVIFVNSEPSKKVLDDWSKAYYVGARAEESGTIGGQLIAEYFKMHPEADKNGDGILQYILIKGERDHQDVPLRSDYCVKAMMDAGVQVYELTSGYANWDVAKTRHLMQNIIPVRGLESIEAILANNDTMALGALQVLQAHGYNLGSYSKTPSEFIPIVGVDATADALQAIAHKQMTGTALNDAKGQGKAAVSLAVKLAKGQEVTKDSIIGFTVSDDAYIWVPYVRITQVNCKDYL